MTPHISKEAIDCAGAVWPYLRTALIAVSIVAVLYGVGIFFVLRSVYKTLKAWPPHE